MARFIINKRDAARRQLETAALLDFTELILLDAMATYAQVTGEIPTIFNAFSNWLGMQKPHIYGGQPEAKKIMFEAQKHFGTMTRLEFLKKYLSTAATIPSANDKH